MISSSAGSSPVCPSNPDASPVAEVFVVDLEEIGAVAGVGAGECEGEEVEEVEVGSSPGGRPPIDVIFPKRAEPPALILASRRSFRSRACSAAADAAGVEAGLSEGGVGVSVGLAGVDEGDGEVASIVDRQRVGASVECC